jgi:GNAT superfamily N-acetyltransferase
MANALTTIDEQRSAPPRTIVIRLATARDEILVPGLCALLQDAVHGGASIGFLAPLAMPTTLRYWRGVFADLDRQQVLWIALDDGAVVGTVQLGLCLKDNGSHRAEVQKLLVRSDFQRRGIARDLMRAVDRYALANNRSLLVLDTIAGSAAELLYRNLGWQKSGEIPAYAAMPDGELRPTAVYFRLLEPASMHQRPS